MKIIRTIRIHRPSFSEDNKVLALTAPRSWKDLNQDQLHYVLTLLSTFEDHTVVKTYMFVRFTGLHIVRKDRYGWKCFIRQRWGRRRFLTIQAWQVESLLGQFSYVDSYEDMGVRLDDIRGLRAVDVLLHGVRFVDYLNMEKYYQAYSIHKEDRFLSSLALLLYRRKDGSTADRIHTDRAQLLGTFLWYSYIKSEFGRAFPHFFRKIPPESVASFDFIASMNAQIRALTDGDVTKEDLIFNSDCWRALTELDAKAREAEEFNAKYNK